MDRVSSEKCGDKTLRIRALPRRKVVWFTHQLEPELVTFLLGPLPKQELRKRYSSVVFSNGGMHSEHLAVVQQKQYEVRAMRSRALEQIEYIVQA